MVYIMNNSNLGAGVGCNSRFIRSRGKGSWNKGRPYYFRTGGNVKRSKSNIPSVFPQVAGGPSDCLQTNAFFTAPVYNGDEKLRVISIINPVQYPGWRLYFQTEIFSESSPLVFRIKAFEKHIQKHPSAYNLSEILQQEWFKVYASILLRDDEFCMSWSNFSEDLHINPYNVLSCLGVGMHHAVTTMANVRYVEAETYCRLNQYKRRNKIIPKIIARPVDFLNVSSISDITSECFDKMFVINGRVSCITGEETKCSWVAYKCRRCGHEQAIKQTDYCTKPICCRIQCNCKRNFIELRSSAYTKVECVQMIQLDEIGVQNLYDYPCIDIKMRKDLVDQVFPGVEITVMGVLKMKTFTHAVDHQNGTRQNYYMEAVSLSNCWSINSTQKDNEIVQMITMEQNCLRLLIQSLAPEMCGYEMVKLAVLLSLFGGSGSQLHDEGELNVLLIGNPGLGKSNLLKNAASVSQRGKLVSVKAKSIFMPASQNTKNSIFTGSIMMSNAGHCCVDDMEKLSQNQEILIHIMQTKSIISRCHNVALNIVAKPSIIAAVNPASGHYDSSKLLRENVRLSPSFLSLFHMVFIIYDKADKDQDSTLTEHVKALHSGIKQILSIPSKYSIELKPSDYNVQSEELNFDNHFKMNSDEQLDLLPAVLLKKYIDYARNNIKPLLSEDAASKLKEYYMGLRSEKNEEELFSITTRQLEGLILLTQARARADLCSEATKQHVREIIELVRRSHTSIVDIMNTTPNGSIAGTSHGSQIKKFIQMLQFRSNALGRTTFEFEELKDMATHAGIRCGVANLIDVVNIRGYLLKKGPNLYEFITQ